MQVGKKIKNARLQRKMTQEELAYKVGVQKSAIAKWETGRVENIKRSNLQRLAEILEISPAELVGSHETEEPATAPLIREIADSCKDMTDEQLAMVAAYARFLKSGG